MSLYSRFIKAKTKNVRLRGWDRAKAAGPAWENESGSPREGETERDRVLNPPRHQAEGGEAARPGSQTWAQHNFLSGSLCLPPLHSWAKQAKGCGSCGGA